MAAATPQQYPPFVYSVFKRHDGLGTLAYKILGNHLVGEARPLVLVHGLSAVGLVDWLPLAESLAETRPVLIFDNRGVGGSFLPKDRESEEYSVIDMSNDVVELVKHVGFKEIDLLGFSMGGMIAQTLLVRPHLPFKVRHAVLAATSAKAAHSDLLSALPNPTAPIVTIQDKIDLVTPFIYIGYDPSYVKDPKNKALLDRRVLESVMTRRPQKTLARQLSVIAGYDVRPHLSSIPASLPVLIIHGTLDRSVYFSEKKYIEKFIPHATTAVLPRDDIGHMWYDYFGTPFWTDLLNSFLDDRDAPPIVCERKAKL